MSHSDPLRPWFGLLLLCALFSVSESFDFHISANVTLHTDQYDDYFITIKEGESVELICEAHGGQTWVLPNNTDFKGHEESDIGSRIQQKPGADPLEVYLTIARAKPSDTGEYLCKSEHSSKGNSVYVFVKGNRFFIPYSIAGMNVYIDHEFVIPCKSSWPSQEEEGSIELYSDKELWKTASKEFDPKIGFRITPKMHQKKITGPTAFECRFNGIESDHIEFFINPEKTSSDDEFQFKVYHADEWPYIGGSLNITCSLSRKPTIADQIFKQIVNITCPRCDKGITTENNAEHYNPALFGGNEFRRGILLHNLTALDGGEYACSWYREKDHGTEHVLHKRIPFKVSISPTEGQIKVKNRTAVTVRIEEGSQLMLFANLSTYPQSPEEYTSKWTRSVLRPPKTTADIEFLLNDGTSTISTEHKGSYIMENLVVNKVTVGHSGQYSLTSTILDQKRTLDFNVEVKSRQMIPRINISSPEYHMMMEQPYYTVNADLRVLCIVESVPKADVDFLSRPTTPTGAQWNKIEDATVLEGTYESGYSLNFRATDNTEFKCEGRRDGQVRSERKKISVVDVAPQFVITHEKTMTAMANEEGKTIYEGDTVNLECIVPKEEQWTLAWQFKRSPLVAEFRYDDIGHSRHSIATLKNVSAAHSGLYECVVTDEFGKQQILSATITISKTAFPSLHQLEPITNKVFQYGESAEMSCYFDGMPPPMLKWFKDGVDITTDGQIIEKGQRFHTARVTGEDQGEYKCVATNRVGSAEQKFPVTVEGAPAQLTGMKITGIVLLILILLCCIAGFLVLYLRQRKTSKLQAANLQILYEQLMQGGGGDHTPIPLHSKGGKVNLETRVNQIAYDQKYEIDPANLDMIGLLGAGQFGLVSKGRLSRGAPVSDSTAYRGPKIPVAVKSPKIGTSAEHQKALIDEMKILIAIHSLEGGGHPNVLSLVGAVTKQMKEGRLYVVFEMCENGDLKTFLKRYKEDLKDKFVNELKVVQGDQTNDDYMVPNSQSNGNGARMQYASESDPNWEENLENQRLLPDSRTLATSDLISFAMQIAAGMEFLASIPCIHRDLAARNCLLTGGRIVKIADFGMAKNVQKDYYKVKNKNILVPYRWMSLEAMTDHRFSVESDVWAYGITLWEVFSLGSNPYPGVSNENLQPYLTAGSRNHRPEQCHIDIYNMMLRTWDVEPENRPTFTQCYQFMRDHLKLASKDLLEQVEKELKKNAELIAAFDQYRGPRATAQLTEAETAALLNGHGQHDHEEEPEPKDGERIYIKDLRR